MKKRLFSMTFVLALLMTMCIPVRAVEDERIEIPVQSEQEILDFMRSSQYNPNQLYRFIMVNTRSTKSLCPNCGKSTYVGTTATENISVQHLPCVEGLSIENSDHVAVMGTYAIARCSKCLYTTGMPYPSSTYYIITCVAALSGMPEYIAKDGNTFPPHDRHEVKSFWPVVEDWPAKEW